MEFEDGFNVITGETGAGKSILLGGLSLALGKRADLKSISNPDKKCVIEVVFHSDSPNLKLFFEEEELDWEDEIRLRRELTPSGKSRAFINDTPVRLESLAQLGALLIDIHAQHQTLDLFNQKHQMAILDGFAQQKFLLEEYQSYLKNFREDHKRLEVLQSRQSELLKASDYKRFLLEELQAAPLKIGLKEELEEQHKTLTNASTIIEHLSASHQLLTGEEYGVVDQTRSVKQLIAKLSTYASHFEHLNQRIESVLIELNDISAEIEQQQGQVELNPSLLDEISDQLQKIYDLEHKHQVSSVEELLEIKQALEAEQVDFDAIQDQINQLLNSTKEQADNLRVIANKLRIGRLNSIESLQQALVVNLKQLGMPNARFKIELRKQDDLNDLGIDQVEFLFSANSGGEFGSLKKIASGGELSRIMLSIKSVLAQYIDLSTILFDEIDAGVSGEISNKMATIMYQLSHHMQLFAITHLPQVAAKGTYHYKVLKEDDGTKARTTIVKLSEKERIQEIAQMLDGKNYSSSAQEHAKQLLLNEN